MFEDEALDQVSLFDLIGAFQKVLQQRKKVTIHRVQEIAVSLEERLDYVQKQLQERGELEFSELFLKTDTRMVMIVTFIAILELIRRRMLHAVQEINFAAIKLKLADG